MDLPAVLGPERLRTYPVIAVVVAGLAWAGWLFASREGLDPAGRPVGGDYVAFHAAGRLVAEGRAADVYDSVALQAEVRALIPRTEAVLPVHYPPPALLAFAVPARLPFAAGFALWTVGSVGALCALFAWLRCGPLGWRWGLAYPGALLVLFNGQTSAWIAASVCGGLALAGRNPVAGGLLVGLAVCKPNYVVLPLVALAVAGRWRALAAAALSAAALCALSALWLGLEPWRAWIDHLPEIGALVAGDRLQLDKMPTVAATLAWWGVVGPAAQVVQGLFAASAVGAVAVAARRGPDQAVTAVSLGTFLLTPFAFDYDLVVAWAGLYVLATRPSPPWVLIAGAWALPLALPTLAGMNLPLAPLLLGVLLFHGLSRPVDPAPTG